MYFYPRYTGGNPPLVDTQLLSISNYAATIRPISSPTLPEYLKRKDIKTMIPDNIHVVDHFLNCVSEDVYYLENIDSKFRDTFEIILGEINNHFDSLFDILENYVDEDPNLTRYMLTNTAGKQETAKIALACAYHLTMRHDGDPFKAWEWGLNFFETHFLCMRYGFERLDYSKVIPIIDRITKILINQKLSVIPSEVKKLAHYDMAIGDIAEAFDALKKAANKNFLSRLFFRNDIREIDKAFEDIASLKVILDPVGNPFIDNWKKYEEFIESDTISQYDFATTQVMIKDYVSFKSDLDIGISGLRRLARRIKSNVGL